VRQLSTTHCRCSRFPHSQNAPIKLYSDLKCQLSTQLRPLVGRIEIADRLKRSMSATRGRPPAQSEGQRSANRSSRWRRTARRGARAGCPRPPRARTEPTAADRPTADAASARRSPCSPTAAIACPTRSRLHLHLHDARLRSYPPAKAPRGGRRLTACPRQPSCHRRQERTASQLGSNFIQPAKDPPLIIASKSATGGMAELPL
jgi:hypothetical protein